MDNIEAVKKIADINCADCADYPECHEPACRKNQEDKAEEICQLFPKTEDNPNGFELPTTGGVSANPPEIKPSASRLLTDNGKMYLTEQIFQYLDRSGEAYNNGSLSNQNRAKYIMELIEGHLKAQRDRTVSIKDQEYAEHLAHLVDDVINLEEKLKSKDAEIEDLKFDAAFRLSLKDKECQQRVEGIKKKIEKKMYNRSPRMIMPDELEDIWKKEGIE